MDSNAAKRVLRGRWSAGILDPHGAAPLVGDVLQRPESRRRERAVSRRSRRPQSRPVGRVQLHEGLDQAGLPDARLPGYERELGSPPGGHRRRTPATWPAAGRARAGASGGRREPLGLGGGLATVGHAELGQHGGDVVGRACAVEITRRAAISASLRPSPTRSSTSCSRAVSPCGCSRVAGRAPDRHGAGAGGTQLAAAPSLPPARRRALRTARAPRGGPARRPSPASAIAASYGRPTASHHRAASRDAPATPPRRAAGGPPPPGRGGRPPGTGPGRQWPLAPQHVRRTSATASSSASATSAVAPQPARLDEGGSAHGGHHGLVEGRGRRVGLLEQVRLAPGSPAVPARSRAAPGT